MKGVKSKTVLERQLSVFAAVDEGFSAKLAQTLGVQPVPKLNVKPAAEAVRFKANIAAL